MVSQNGGPPGKKSSSLLLPELEYREKGRDSTTKERDGKKPSLLGINNNNIIHALDSNLQEAEYIENYVGAKRLNTELAGDMDGSTHSSHKDEMGKNYKNTSGTSNSSPQNHSSANGSLPASSSANKSEKKQKGAGKGQRDPVENCIPNNQLGKPDALVRYGTCFSHSL